MTPTSSQSYSVYILWSTLGRCFYIGVSEDVAHRVIQHNAGVSKWTKRYAGTWQLVWQREFPSLGQARKFENRLKKQKGGDGFWRLTELNRLQYESQSGS
ncbi:MAG: GIY-YIG nuclease family protein [Verrucomicrobia bacterium]|nr:GIY-YIG nuclease family protein [Verrucomicrobiota bacterium]